MTPIKIMAAGAAVTSSGSSQSITIPNDSTGNKAKTVLVTVEGLTYILPGIGLTATAACTIASANAPLLLDVTGMTTIAVLQLTAAQIVTVNPVES